MDWKRKIEKVLKSKALPLWITILILFLGPIFGGFFTAFGDDLYQSCKDWYISYFGTPKLDNATLKAQTITLYGDIMQFMRERGASEPSIDFNNWEESSNNITRYMQETMSLYHENFGSRVVELREEYLKRGITNDKVELSYIHPTNPLGIQELAYGLAELASKIEP